MSEKKAKVVKPEVQAKFGPSLLVFLLVTAVILVGILVLGLDAHIPIVIAAMASSSMSRSRIWSTR